MIQSGDIIQGPRWPEPVAVTLVEPIANGLYYRIVGATRLSRTHVDQLISQAELAQLQQARVDTGFGA